MLFHHTMHVNIIVALISIPRLHVSIIPAASDPSARDPQVPQQGGGSVGAERKRSAAPFEARREPRSSGRRQPQHHQGGTCDDEFPFTLLWLLWCLNVCRAEVISHLKCESTEVLSASKGFCSWCVLLLQVFSDQLLLQDVLARSDRAMAVVKDLFGDAPRRQTGMNLLHSL